jgi:two-component system chemotaxis response regulator CheY
VESERDLERVSVLVVDDNEDLRTIVVSHFRDAGFSVLDAHNIEEAIHMVHLGIVDVIVTDFNMPGGTGLDLLEQVRADNRDIPVFLMTGNADLCETMVMEQGGAGLFRKPIALGHGMTAVVKNYLIVKAIL